MNLFRTALRDAVCDKFNENPNMIWFRPAEQYVPRAWVERMAELEWECEETGTCSHCSTRGAGCYFGQETKQGWICDALLKDGGVLKVSVEKIAANLN